MRHRARRSVFDLRHGRFRALAAVVVLCLLAGGYAAATSLTGGSSDTDESAGPTTTRDHELTSESRDFDRPSAPGSPVQTDLPSSEPPTSSDPSAPVTSAARQPGRTGTPASAPESPSPTARDDEPPQTSLSAEYPAGDTARFTFSASESATFSCSLDGAAFSPCDSPTAYSGLDPGWHTFAVRATDAGGNVDPSPAETRWHADGSPANP